MPKRIAESSHDYLINAPLPEATDTYTVIPHGDVINKTREILGIKGYIIERELYKCTVGAKVAQGVYHLKHGNDPDMSMMFAWNNSYDKSQKFKCCIGAYVHASLSSIIKSDLNSWGRKHTGSADNEAFETITNQIENADAYFQQLLEDKEVMKQLTITEEKRAELLGRLYFVHELLSGEQLAIIKSEFTKPSYNYGSPADSLWTMYNAIIYALQKSHPKSWMSQQVMIHWFLCNQFNIIKGQTIVNNPNKSTEEIPLTDPNQINLLDAIAEAEAEHEVISENNNDPNVQLREEADIEIAHAMGGLPEEEHPLDKVYPGEKKPDTTGHNFLEIADETITVERRTEEELNHELHGVDNGDNAIASFHPISIDPVEVDELMDLSWPCLKCGEMQGPADTYHDGQLCSKCAAE